ncbi:MAG TPA: MmcQ/YjbR family DNA-binding protein [Caulobacteraceae bacterium]|nr:MmcQ/YjbR family DNA-binding protein [Caulobacteraceae bacterium]
MDLGERTADLKAILEAKPGAEATAVAAPGSRPPSALMFKVKGKLFAILSIRGAPFVILKSDPHLVELLREQYAGVGHRSHLDRRFWISVSLDADVPPQEIERLISNSYELVREGLTRKQQAELAALSS